ncbi:MAG: hypothetical protein PHX34_04510 [Candidatus Shapirobacteria bacterium]|nr:hypothetical protein [Candidatus Shapirobacteria bacterium]
MNCDEFIKNSLVENFIKQVITDIFPKKSAPNWINYELFYNDMLKKASKNLYSDIRNDTDNWWMDMLFPYIAYCIDESSMDNLYNEYVEYAPMIPEDVINLIRS